MRIREMTLHNFRSIDDAKINLGNYSLLVGANNSGKSNVIDSLRVFYEKGLKFEDDRDFPAQSRNRVISRFFQGHHDAHLTVTCDV